MTASPAGPQGAAPAVPGRPAPTATPPPTPAPYGPEPAPVRRREPLLRAEAGVPNLLRLSAAWSWRLLVVAAAIGLVAVGLGRLRVVVIPLLAALLLTALLRPAMTFLRDRGVPRLAATWVVLIGLLALLAGVAALLGTSVGQQFGDLGNRVSAGVDRVRDYATNGPFHFSHTQIDSWVENARTQVKSNRSTLVSGAFTGAALVAEVLAGVILTLFITFFFLYDGERIWNWVAARFPAGAQDRAHGAGRQAWATLTGYIRGTAFVALVDAAGIGLALVVMRVPLVAPLILLTFLGGFIPLVGATIAGAAAVLVALVAKGPLAALVVLAAVIAVQQLEGHVLQPMVLGRAVHLHPLAIALSLAAGAVVAGIPGAVVAVPLVAVVNRVAGYLAREGNPETAVERPVQTRAT